VIRLPWLFFMLPVIAVGCGSRQRPDTPEDVVLRQDARAGSQAFSLDHPEQAVAQYQLALERARARDDVVAIGDYGYDLAVSQLASNRPAQALAAARLTETELARRGRTSFPALVLVQAVALYRLGRKADADSLAAQAEDGGEPVVAMRASFLRGLIADESDNPAGLNAALARFAHPVSPQEQADADELAARRDLRQGSFGAAAIEAEHAADLRRSVLEYRDMARALSLAGDAMKRGGDAHAAADLYMRAGQSAAAQGDAQTARSWLRQALVLTEDPAKRRAVRQALAAVANSGADGPKP
jgi:hypothetical protein